MQKKRVEGLRETGGRPTLSRAIRGSCAHGDSASTRASARFDQHLYGAISSGIRNLQRDVRIVGQIVDPAYAAQQFEIIESFVCWGFTGLRDRDGIRQQSATAIAGVANALRYAGTPGKPGGAEGILEKQRQIEFLGANFGSERFPSAPSMMFSIGVVRNQLVRNTLPAIEVSDVRAGNDGEMRTRKVRAYGTQGGKRHDRIAHPVRCANHNSHAAHTRDEIF